MSRGESSALVCFSSLVRQPTNCDEMVPRMIIVSPRRAKSSRGSEGSSLNTPKETILDRWHKRCEDNAALLFVRLAFPVQILKILPRGLVPVQVPLVQEVDRAENVPRAIA